MLRKKAEEKAKKTADKDKPSLIRKSRKKCLNKSLGVPSTDLSQPLDETGTSSSMAESSVVTLPIQDSTLQSSHDDYECSECFGTYREDKEMGNGAEWVQCGCGQWIHEECISNTVIGSDCTERMCSNCVL